MKKLKALTAIMLGGLALTSCADNSNGGSKASSFNIIRGFDVLAIAVTPADVGCDIELAGVQYDTTDYADDIWEGVTINATTGQKGVAGHNVAYLGGYASAISCVTSDQFALWS